MIETDQELRELLLRLHGAAGTAPSAQSVNADWTALRAYLLATANVAGLGSEDSEDAVQLLALRLIRQPELLLHIASASSPRNYAFTALRNILVDQYRRRVHPDSEALVHAAADPMTTAPDEAALILSWAKERLTDSERELYAMRFEQDLTTQQIADQLGISVGAAYQRVFRLVARLRLLIGPR